MIRIECFVCGATGLYTGLGVPEGEAVVCRECLGLGWRDIQEPKHTLFTTRRNQPGVTLVRAARAMFTDRGIGEAITYADFKLGIRPEKGERR